MIFLIILQVAMTVLVVSVSWFLIRRRNHRVILPRDLLTLIPFLGIEYAQGLIVSVSIIIGKPLLWSHYSPLHPRLHFCRYTLSRYITMAIN